jgi:hypothetical protein
MSPRLNDWDMYGPIRAARGFAEGEFEYAEKNSFIVEPDSWATMGVANASSPQTQEFDQSMIFFTSQNRYLLKRFPAR